MTLEIPKRDKVEKLLWLDMEMTGLDVNKEVVIEVACIVTDLNFREYESFETVVKQPQAYIDRMDAWNTEHHAKSGLTAKIPFGIEPENLEYRLLDIIDRHFAEGLNNPRMRPILAGNSINQDRVFIERYFPKVASRLHYRTLDVSSWKIIFSAKYDFEYKKMNSHRALDDIRESISELRTYVDKIHFE
ncbi:MAG: oligoribonuclease [Pseudobdellovibrio sp.]